MQKILSLTLSSNNNVKTCCLLLALFLWSMSEANSQAPTDAEIEFYCTQETQRNVKRETLEVSSVLGVMRQSARDKEFEEAKSNYMASCQQALTARRAAAINNSTAPSPSVDWDLFVQQYPDSQSHIAEIKNMVDVDNDLSPYIAYLQLKTFFKDNGMDW